VLPDVFPLRPGAQPLIQAGPTGVPRRQENDKHGDNEHWDPKEEDRDKAKYVVDPLILPNRRDHTDRNAHEKGDDNLEEAKLNRRGRPRRDFVQHRLFLREGLAEVKSQGVLHEVDVLLWDVLVQTEQVLRHVSALLGVLANVEATGR